MRLSMNLAATTLVAALGLAGAAVAQPAPAPGPHGPGMMNHMGGHPMMMGPGMMMGNGTWCGGCGYMGPGWGAQRANLNLSAADVKSFMERYLQHQGNPRVKLGAVKEADADTVTADVVTTEGNALVQRYLFDRHTGAYRPG